MARALPDLKARLQLSDNFGEVQRNARTAGREIQAGLAPAEASLQRFPGHMARVSRGSSDMGGAFASTRVHMAGMSSAALGATGAFAAVAASAAIVGAAIGSTVTAGVAYQDQMNTLQAVSGASAGQMAALGQKAIDLGNDLTLPSTSAADAAGAMVELAKAGLDVDQTMAAAKGTLQLAAAAGIDEATAATYTATALNAFHLQGSEAVRIADLLAAAANASAAEIGDVGLALAQSSAVFAAAHVPIQTLVALIGEMANAGIKGSDAGTSLKTMMLALETPTTAASLIFEKLKIHIYDSHGAMLPFRDIIGNVHDALQGLNQEQRDQALSTIFGSDAIRAANVIFGQGTQTFDAMSTAVQKHGAAADVAAAKSKGLGGAGRALGSQFETLQLQLFQGLAPGLELVVRWISDLVQHLESGTPAAGAMGDVLNFLRTTGAGAGEAFRQIASVVRALTPFIMELVALFAAQLRPQFQAIAAHSSELKILFGALAIAIAIVIFGLAGMVVFVVSVIRYTLELVAAIDQGVMALVRFGGSVVGAFQAIPGVVAAVAAGIAAGFGSALTAVQGWLSAVVAAFLGVVGAIGGALAGGLAVVQGWIASVVGVFVGMAQAVYAAMLAVSNFIGVVLGVIGQIFLVAFAIWLGLWLTIVDAIAAVIRPPLQAIVSYIAGVWAAIVASAQAAWGALSAVVGGALNALWVGVIQPIWNAALGFLTNVWNLIVAVGSAAWSSLTSLIGTFLQLEWTGIQIIWNAVFGFLQGIWNTITGVATAAWSAITGLIGRFNQQTSTQTQSTWSALFGWLQGIWNTIHGAADAAWSGVYNTITSWVNRMSSTVQGIWNGMVSAAERFGGDLAAKIRSGVRAVVDVLNIFIDKANSAIHPLLGRDVVGKLDVRGLASGGELDYRQAGTGFMATRPTVLVGEGRGREWVIPEDPRYRSNAFALLNSAARSLGYIGLQAGGILDWLPNAGPMVQGPFGGFTHAAIFAATGGRAWDYMAPNNSPVFAGLPGTVLPGPGGGYGTSISFNLDVGGSVILGHLARILASGHVAKGTQIALSDNTGFSTGPHLHWEIRGNAMSPGPGGAGGIDIHALIKAALSPLTSAAHAALNGISPDFIRDMANKVVDQMADKISGLAGGGPVVPGSAYLVGERGPELFSPREPGSISARVAGVGGDRVGELLGKLDSIDRRLAAIQGADAVSTRTAARAF